MASAIGFELSVEVGFTEGFARAGSTAGFTLSTETGGIWEVRRVGRLGKREDGGSACSRGPGETGAALAADAGKLISRPSEDRSSRVYSLGGSFTLMAEGAAAFELALTGAT